ncbi:MAG: superfamily phosphatase [bacterium]|nr:superfamily phosphatase [bacterium]
MASLRKTLPKALIFDIDGTLLDVKSSFYATAIEASKIWWEVCERTSPPFDGNLILIEKLKTFPGFNDDWDVSIAIILLQKYLQGKGADPIETLIKLKPQGLSDLEKKTGITLENKSFIRKICMEIYGGRECEKLYGFKPSVWNKEGYWQRERPLFDISKATKTFKIGIYTGRTWPETRNALFLLNLRLKRRFIVTAEEYKKPDPRGLFKLVHELKVNHAVFIGDSEDDRLTVLNYRKIFKLPFIDFIHVKDITYLKSFGLEKI